MSHAIYIIIALLPVYLIRFSLWGIPFTLLEVMVLALFFAFLIKNYSSFDFLELKKSPFFWPIVVILAIATISVFTSPDIKAAAGIWKAYFIEPILFFIVFVSVIKTKQQLAGVFWALGFSAAYLSLIAIWQFFSGWNMPAAFLTATGSVDRVVSVFGYPNALGLYLGPIIVLFTGFLFYPLLDESSRSSYFKNFLKLLVIILSFTTIVLAKSEAAVMSVLFIWFVWGIIGRKTRPYFIVLGITLVISFAGLPELKNYLAEKLLFRDWSGFIRTLIWAETWQMIKNNWLFGAGLAGYQAKIAAYHREGFEIYLYPHNIFFNFWSELGLFGLLAFSWLGISFAVRNLVSWLKNRANVLNLTLLLVVIQMFIHGLVDVPYFKNDLSILFWIIIGVYVVGLSPSFLHKSKLD